MKGRSNSSHSLLIAILPTTKYWLLTTMPTLNFQQMILRLLEYWQEQGCIVWQPYNVQVGAGTMNPATILRVLGP